MSWYWKCMQQAADDVLASAAQDADPLVYDIAWAHYSKFTSYAAYLQSLEWKDKAREAVERAGHHCQLCNRADLPFHVHHRTYERLGCEQPEDLIALCEACHQHHHWKVPTYAKSRAATTTIR